MTATRLEPNWFTKRLAEDLTVGEIGYLIGLINECSTIDSTDGRLRAYRARHITECDDPDAVIARLAAVGQVAWDGEFLIVHGGKPWRVIKAAIADSLRARVYARDGHACLACGATGDLTCDHIIAEVNGGRTEFDNLQTLCRACNSSKGVARIDYRRAA